MRRLILTAVSLAAAAFPSAGLASSVIPVLKSGAADPSIETSKVTSALVIDTASGKTLYRLNPSKSWAAASLTKLMTAYVFSNGRKNWSAKGTITRADEVGGGRLRLPSGSSMTVRDLLYSALIGSANNAANALARLSGRGRAGFISEMNHQAQVLGLTQTSFADASGISPKNASTAYDLAMLMDEVSEQAEPRKAMQTARYSFRVATPKHITKTVLNTNRLLTQEPDVEVIAGKTGYLEESMYNYAVKVRPAIETDRELIVVVFGAPSRSESIDDAAQLAKWTWNSFDWAAASSTPARFNRNLHEGDRGTDVTALQKFLNAGGFPVSASGPGSPGRETDKFGLMTAAALKRFQAAHAADVIAPQGRKQGSGVLDFATRAFINQINSPSF